MRLEDPGLEYDQHEVIEQNARHALHSTKSPTAPRFRP